MIASRCAALLAAAALSAGCPSSPAEAPAPGRGEVEAPVTITTESPPAARPDPPRPAEPATGAGASEPASDGCGLELPETKVIVTVSTVDALFKAVREARPSSTILVEDGEYRLPRTLDVSAPGVVIRGKSGDPAKAVLRGAGMEERDVGVAISVGAPRVTLADLTVGWVGYHGVQVRGERGASNAVFHRLRIVDTGQQLLKGSVDGKGTYADGGLVACSTFEYTDSAPSDYTNGVDVLAAKGWTVRDCRFFRIRGPRAKRHAAGPAILFWMNAQETTVERNLIVDCFRGVAFGLGPPRELARDGEKRYDHQGGAIRNNVIVNLNIWGDEGIEVNAGRDARIDHNTVYVDGHLDWSVSVRFPASTGCRVRNNLVKGRVVARDGAEARTMGNVTHARQEWFVDVGKANLRLADLRVPAIDAGVDVPEVLTDFDRGLRLLGGKPDAGAFEFIPE